MGLAHDVADFVTGARPAVRNRVKFLLLSPIYDGFFRLLPENPHAEIAARVPPTAHRLLDLCTGTALVPAVIAPARPDLTVVGLDLSPEMLDVGRAKLARRDVRNAPLVRADAGRLPFGDATFDAVSVSYGLHELPTDVRARTAREIRRVLRPDGVLLVADVERPVRFGAAIALYLRVFEPAHAREVLGDGLARLLRDAGFSVQRAPAGSPAMPMQLLVARPAPG